MSEEFSLDKPELPKRIQRKRTRGWKMPPNAVYVGRPTEFGNPIRLGGYFAVGAMGMVWCEAAKGYQDSRFTLIETREQAVKLYREIAAKHPPKNIAQLRGKDLACWCPLVDKDGNPVPCHADVLLEIANA